MKAKELAEKLLEYPDYEVESYNSDLNLTPVVKILIYPQWGLVDLLSAEDEHDD